MMVLSVAYNIVRNIDKLKGELFDDEINRLKEWGRLETAEQRDEYHAFCRSLKGEKAIAMSLSWSYQLARPLLTIAYSIAWYAQKSPINSDGTSSANAWILKALNKHESPMPGEYWFSTPHDTNLAEGSHAGRNRVTGTQLSLLEAIET